jgi:hypothetical protein
MFVTEKERPNKFDILKRRQFDGSATYKFDNMSVRNYVIR